MIPRDPCSSPVSDKGTRYYRTAVPCEEVYLRWTDCKDSHNVCFLNMDQALRKAGSLIEEGITTVTITRKDWNSEL